MIGQFLYQTKEKLAAVTDSPVLEAEVLLAYVLHRPRSYLHAWPEKTLTEEQARLFAACVERRCHGEPIAYITGMKEFWSLDLMVSPDTLIPRPETELLVEWILNLASENQATMKVADLGTGSGAIALAIAQGRPAWHVHATDISESALQIARKNAQQLGLNNVSFYQGSWCTALPCSGFDIIVSNPPYIAETEWETYAQGLAFEPRHALVSGKDGLEAIREICSEAKNYLNSAGYLLVEHGFLQGAAVRGLFAEAGYDAIGSIRDLAGQERVTMARWGS